MSLQIKHHNSTVAKMWECHYKQNITIQPLRKCGNVITNQTLQFNRCENVGMTLQTNITIQPL